FFLPYGSFRLHKTRGNSVLSGRGTARHLSELAEIDGLDPVTGAYRIRPVSFSSPETSCSANGESS
ncbi:MAG: hypothetical protein ABF701_08845, partial [Acetobacter syzygii]